MKYLPVYETCFQIHCTLLLELFYLIVFILTYKYDFFFLFSNLQ